MSNKSQLRGVAFQNSPGRAAEGTYVGLRQTRDGSPYTIDLFQAFALEGRTFTAALGSASSPSADMDAYNATKPEMILDVPTGTAIIPLQILVKIDTHGATLNETFAVASPTILGGTGTALTINPVRTDNPMGSQCSALGALSGDATTPVATGSFEFWRSGSPVDFDNAGEPLPTMIWSAQRFVPPVITDGGSIAIYCSGTTPVGSITVTWAELPQSAIV